MLRVAVLTLLAACVGLSLGAIPATAQAARQDTVTLRGTIVAGGSDAPLPFSIVELTPAGAQRFTDQDGAFAFVELEPGSYRLRVRQIGYRPRDTTITLKAGTAQIRIALLHIAIRLDAITVTGKTSCVMPGAPDPGLNPQLSAVFEVLLENARRYRLLADACQYRSSTLRTFTTVNQDRLQVALSDTLQRESWNRWDYRPGHVVGPPDQDNEMMVRLPTPGDFADLTLPLSRIEEQRLLSIQFLRPLLPGQ